MPRQQRQPGLAGVLLAAQLLQVGVDRVPVVTMVTLCLNAAIFYGLLDGVGPWPATLFYPDRSCVSLRHVLHEEDWKRLLLAGLVHADEWHLYYNMVSFLWKGRALEWKLGSQHFACLLVLFTPLVNVVMLLLNYLFGEYVLVDHSYYNHCAVGFSGVIFALKVLTTFEAAPGSVDYVAGWLVPSRYACWAELLFIQLVTPNASFTGHLAGILVGLAYAWGPLRLLTDVFVAPGPSYTYWSGTTADAGQASGGTSRRPFGSRWLASGQQQSSSSRAYDEYTGGLSEAEQLRHATQASVTSAQRSPGFIWSSTSSSGRFASGDYSPEHPTSAARPSAPPSPDDDVERENLRLWRLQRFQ